MAESLYAIDDAFLRLRRLWASSRHAILDLGASSVELSSLLVVETCARRNERRQEANVSDVAYLADVAPSTASRLVDAAEQAGLLVRARSKHSGRRTALELTADGWSLRARAVAARQDWLTDQLRDWPRADVDAFAELLQRFADQLRDRPVRLDSDQQKSARPASAQQASSASAVGSAVCDVTAP